jgi:DNA-binding Lrp family transcriptional regulator
VRERLSTSCTKDLILIGRRSESGSKEEEVVEAVDEIDDVDVCHVVVSMDSKIGDDNCMKDLILIGRRSESGSKEEVAVEAVDEIKLDLSCGSWYGFGNRSR